MIEPGLASVTFRKKSPQEIIRLAVRASMKCIEWGSDFHVPVGDLHNAARIRNWTEAAGLRVSTYGSYYIVGENEDSNKPLFDQILATAEALGAPLIRIWAGRFGSKDASPGYRERIISETRTLADKAKFKGKLLAFEFHENTLNDGYEACYSLLKEIANPQVKTLWQPMHEVGVDVNGEGIPMILPWIVGIHVFHWWPAAEDRLPLYEGYDEWRHYVELLTQKTVDITGTLEFVKDDRPEQFLRDARIWCDLLLEPGIAATDYLVNDHAKS